LIIVHEHRGIPDGLVVCHLPYGPTAFFGIHNAVLRHDIGTHETVPQQYPHLIFNNFSTKLGERFQTILKHLFPPAKDDSLRVATFANSNDFVSFRHHTYKKIDDKNVELTEVGPRFELKPYQIRLGTINEDYADNEWVLREYMNSARTRQAL
jgi:U3 small nucleolar ribonucleoprotein protein IMP4